jgi:hypothetical protein
LGSASYHNLLVYHCWQRENAWLLVKTDQYFIITDI